MFQLDHGDHRPIYEQIKEKIKELIIAGILKENDKVPSVRELAAVLTINPNTIQKAYRELEFEGYIYSLRAKGSFVSPKGEVVKKSDTDGITKEYRDIVSKIKFLGISKEELQAILDEEYKGKE